MPRAPRLSLAARTLSALTGLALAGALTLTAEAADVVRIGGTGSALGGMQRLADAFTKDHPDIEVIVLPSLGSGGGIKALAADKIELSVSARPLKPEEVSSGLIERQYATTPLVLATRLDTAADGLTLPEMASVYTGESTAWPDGTRLRVVMRPAAEADTSVLRAMSAEMDAAIEKAIGNDTFFVAINDQDNATALEKIGGSLGLIALGQLQSEGRELKPLTIDGSAGSLEALRSGSYPHTKRLYIMTTPEPTPAARTFLAFVASAEGARILSETGHLPTDMAIEP